MLYYFLQSGSCDGVSRVNKGILLYLCVSGATLLSAGDYPSRFCLSTCAADKLRQRQVWQLDDRQRSKSSVKENADMAGLRARISKRRQRLKRLTHEWCAACDVGSLPTYKFGTCPTFNYWGRGFVIYTAATYPQGIRVFWVSFGDA